jgi:hypothetical protein
MHSFTFLLSLSGQIDEVYIGTAAERAAKNMDDSEANLQIGAGHMIILPGFYVKAPKSLEKASVVRSISPTVPQVCS